jgi:hypothetical protein
MLCVVFQTIYLLLYPPLLPNNRTIPFLCRFLHLVRFIRSFSLLACVDVSFRFCLHSLEGVHKALQESFAALQAAHEQITAVYLARKYACTCTGLPALRMRAQAMQGHSWAPPFLFSP